MIEINVAQAYIDLSAWGKGKEVTSPGFQPPKEDRRESLRKAQMQNQIGNNKSIRGNNQNESLNMSGASCKSNISTSSRIAKTSAFSLKNFGRNQPNPSQSYYVNSSFNKSFENYNKQNKRGKIPGQALNPYGMGGTGNDNKY